MKINPTRTTNFNGYIFREVQVLQDHGLHVRPAGFIARLASDAKDIVTIIKDRNEVSARSIMSIMTLEVQKGEKIKFKFDSKLVKENPKLIKALVECAGASNLMDSTRIMTNYFATIGKKV